MKAVLVAAVMYTRALDGATAPHSQAVQLPRGCVDLPRKCLVSYISRTRRSINYSFPHIYPLTSSAKHRSYNCSPVHRP
ncbi:hypothetical protein EDD17DRAFT_1681159 [Pisolithus thermaeus]|nr:hypothetical protein EDD17DRAFT_1681159 [Pisolithus thermaeus]